MTWEACAGYPAPPSASNQDLWNKGGICFSSHLSPRGSEPFLRVQQGHLSPGADLQMTKCPSVNTPLHNVDLCLHWQEKLKNQITMRVIQ